MIATALLVCGAVLAQPAIENGSFEELDADGNAVEWRTALWGRDDIAPATATVVRLEAAPDGSHVARTMPEVAIYSAWAQGLTNLRPGQWYELSAMGRCLSFVTLLNWNDFTEHSDHARNMGLVRVDGSAKPSYHAYRFMTQTIGDRRVADWSYGANGTRVYRFSGNSPLWMAWNALRAAKTTINVGEHAVFPCDMYGAKLSTVPLTGKVSIDVGAEPVYIMAGGP